MIETTSKLKIDMDPRGLVLFTLVVGVVTLLILLRRFTHMERMAMIDRNMHPDDFYRFDNRNNLRLALMGFGGGAGLLVGDILSGSSRTFSFGITHVSFMLMYGGLGLLAFYVIEWLRYRKEQKQLEIEEELIREES